MGMFKVGDKARLTKDNHGFGREGDVVSILAVDDGTAYCRFGYYISSDSDWCVPVSSLAAITTNNAHTSNPAAEVDNLRDEYGPVGVDANDNGLGSTAGFTVPVFGDEPETAKFKVGDRVVATSDYPRGHEGRVRLVDHRSPEYLVAFDGWRYGHGVDENEWWMKACELRLVAEATSGKNPAIVCKMDGNQPAPSARPFVHADISAASSEASRLAEANPGKAFAVYECKQIVKVDVTYDHEWQRLAVDGRKIEAIKKVRAATGFTLKGAKDAVEHWLAVNAA